MLRQGADNKIDLYEYAAIAQLVEQGTENPCVLGSIPSCGIFFLPLYSKGFRQYRDFIFLHLKLKWYKFGTIKNKNL